MTLIIGADGSMGRRYQAILKYLNEPFETFDILDGYADFKTLDYSKYDGFILATPTETHKGWVRFLDQHETPILCEKPLSKQKEDIDFILECKSPLSMMMQYYYMDNPNSRGVSVYDYYNHGKDGLYWDCFQIIALARHQWTVLEQSPIWSATLNGKVLNLSYMDRAYITAVDQFLKGNYFDRDMLRNWHYKVYEANEQCNTRQLV